MHAQDAINTSDAADRQIGMSIRLEQWRNLSESPEREATTHQRAPKGKMGYIGSGKVV